MLNGNGSKGKIKIKALTEAGRKKIIEFYLREMSPTHDSVVLCDCDGKCPACRMTLSYSNRQWAFCRNRDCKLFSKMQRLLPMDTGKRVEEIIKNGCEQTAKSLIWVPGAGRRE